MSAQDNHDRSIPTRADDPVPIMFWDPLEFILAFTILGLSVALNLWLVGALLCGFVLWAMKRLKRGAKRGAAQHALWSSGMSIDRSMQRFEPSWINELIA